MLREWLAQLHDWFRRDRLDAELREELRFHAERLEEEAPAAGTIAETPAVRNRLGNVTRIREEARDRWSWPWLEHLLQDVRHTVRGLRRSPAFTLTVVLTLGLGIGANAAMFGLIDRLMFRPHPWLRAPSEVNRVYLQYTFRGETILNSGGHEYARYLDLARWTSSFSQHAGFTARTLPVGIGSEARERSVATVSGTFFSFFDARPVAGRFFGPAEDTTPIGAPVAVLGYDYWQSGFGGREVIGESLRIQNLDYQVIGVAPRGFVGVAEGEAPDLFIPITTYAGSQAGNDDRRNYATGYNWGWMSILVRRNPGVTTAEASADLSTAYVRSWNAERELSPGTPPVEIASPVAIAGPVRVTAGPSAGIESRTLLWVTGVAVVVLLIAGANVINLMLARAVSQRRETAVRLALGVSRGRLLAQTVTESIVLALLGGVVGVALAQWGGAALRGLYAEAGALDVVTDWRTLVMAAGVTLVAGLATGVGSSLAVGRGDLTGSLKSGIRDGGARRSRIRTGLLVFQTTLSVVLLIGAGLFVRSLDEVRSLRLGYDPDRILMATPNLRGAVLDADEIRVLGERLIDASNGFPGVEAAALSGGIPFWTENATYLRVPGIDSVRRLGRFPYQTVTADYFETMGTRILRGRPLEEADRAGTPRVTVVSEGMAAVLWPGRDPLGQCMHVGADTMPCTTVVGVAENAFQNSLTEEQQYKYYLPMSQFGGGPADALLVRFPTDPGPHAEALRAALQAEMPGDGYVTVQPFEGLIDAEQRAWRVGATLFAAFGGLALLVAAVGLYGVIAYSVAQRMHELGIRSALGARAANLVRLVVGQSVRLAGIGTVLGMGVALLAARWIQPLLFRQSATDPVIYGAVAAVLVGVALASSAAPALRATRADPNAALRSE